MTSTMNGTTTELRTRTRACPAWCAERHTETEPDTHQSPYWRGYGLTVVTSQPAGERPTVYAITTSPRSAVLELTEGQAHELGMQLVHAADHLRRARMEASQ